MVSITEEHYLNYNFCKNFRSHIRHSLIWIEVSDKTLNELMSLLETLEK
jgi:hypothetical protein